jgi:hypothetical protein
LGHGDGISFKTQYSIQIWVFENIVDPQMP